MNLKRWFRKHGPRGPYVTSLAHAAVTVAALEPWPLWLPVGPASIALYFYRGVPWPWLAASTLACGWYWVREYRTTGLKPKSTVRTRDGLERTFGQRYDTWLDALFPTAAVGLMFWWLL